MPTQNALTPHLAIIDDAVAVSPAWQTQDKCVVSLAVTIFDTEVVEPALGWHLD